MHLKSRGISILSIKDSLLDGLRKLIRLLKMSRLYKELQPDMERRCDHQSHKKTGLQIPDELANALHESATIGALAGVKTVFGIHTGEKIANDRIMRRYSVQCNSRDEIHRRLC